MSHFHAPFQGKGRGKPNKQDLFPEFMFSKGTCWGGGLWVKDWGGGGGLWPATENCCPYPERSVYTTCKVKQIDPGRRFTCVFVRLPVNLPACHLQSLCCVADPTALSLSFSVCLQWCLCLYFCLCVLLCVHSYVSLPTCVPGLDPEKHLGKPLADMEPYLKQVIGWQILHHTFSLLSPGHYLTFISKLAMKQYEIM